MLLLYNLFLTIFEKLLPLSKFFSSKMKYFVEGRRGVLDSLATHISKEDRVIWLHAASLGEYEQGVPLLEELKAHYPTHKILITFFSPSGYQVKKNNEFAALTTYLPLDTRINAKRFVALAHPELVLFVKYEIWPNYLKRLQHKGIPTLLISGNFRLGQIYFRWYAGFMKKALQSFDHLFVQNQESCRLLTAQGIKNVTVSGDTRFDRVSKQLTMDNRLPLVERFKNNRLCVVLGSTWPEDEALVLDYINHSPDSLRFIIAPHQIRPDHIRALRDNIQKPTVLFSEQATADFSDYQVLIVDNVGLLTRIYAYADIAYVGGAAGKTGLHNILEPAAFGAPVITGKNYRKFPEATALKKEKGLFDVETPAEYKAVMDRFVKDPEFSKQAGQYAAGFIQKNRNATRIIMNYIKKLK